MSIKRIDVIGEFIAEDPAGREHHVIVTQDIIDVGTRAEPHAELPGMRALETTNGWHVNVDVAAATFLLVETNQPLTIKQWLTAPVDFAEPV